MTQAGGRDEVFIRKITEIILENLSDEKFGSRELVSKSGASRYRLIKTLHSATNQTINQFIRATRLRKALELLQTHSYSVSEVAYMTGFSSPPYFNKCFHDFYGYTPGSIREEEQAYALPPPGKSGQTKYFSGGLIILSSLVILFIYPGFLLKKDITPEKPGIAVMPFQNLSNIDSLDHWRHSIQIDLITELSSTGELVVSGMESIAALMKESEGDDLEYLSLIGASVARKLQGDMFVTGSIQKAGEIIRLDARLMESGRGKILKTFEVSGPFSGGQGMFPIIDELRKKLNDYLVMSRIIIKNPYYQNLYTPGSVDALKYYDKAFMEDDPEEDIRLLRKSLKADSSFFPAAIALEYAYSAYGNTDSSRIWLIRNYMNRFRMPDFWRLRACWAYAYTFESYDAQIRSMRDLVELDNNEPVNRYLLGHLYCLSGEYTRAIPELERSLKIFQKWGDKFLMNPNNYRNYKWLGIAYNNTGQFNKQRSLYRKARKYVNYPWMSLMNATLALSRSDSAKANLLIDKALQEYNEIDTSHAAAYFQTARFFKDANHPGMALKYYTRALELEPSNLSLYTGFLDYCWTFDSHVHEKIIDRAMELSNNMQEYCEFLSEKGMCLHEKGDHIGAFATTQKALNDAPFKVYLLKAYHERVSKYFISGK